VDEKEAEMTRDTEHELDRGIADYRGWIEPQYDLPRQRDEMVSHIEDYLIFTDEVLRHWFQKPKCTHRSCNACDPRQWIRQVEHAGCAMLYLRDHLGLSVIERLPSLRRFLRESWGGKGRGMLADLEVQ
jgi:hypothetical protein